VYLKSQLSLVNKTGESIWKKNWWQGIEVFYLLGIGTLLAKKFLFNFSLLLWIKVEKYYMWIIFWDQWSK